MTKKLSLLALALGLIVVGAKDASAWWPSFPVITWPQQITGINPRTGGLDTRSSQINSSAFDPLRNVNQYNGSKRWVSRPVYDQFGRITGYKEGYVWINSRTLQEHGNTVIRRASGLRGVDTKFKTHSYIP